MDQEQKTNESQAGDASPKRGRGRPKGSKTKKGASPKRSKSPKKRGASGSRQSGGGSDWMASHYALTATPMNNKTISAATLANIDKAPMFNALGGNTRIPTGPSVGIIPTGPALAGGLAGGGKKSPRARGASGNRKSPKKSGKKGGRVPTAKQLAALAGGRKILAAKRLAQRGGSFATRGGLYAPPPDSNQPWYYAVGT